MYLLLLALLGSLAHSSTIRGIKVFAKAKYEERSHKTFIIYSTMGKQFNEELFGILKTHLGGNPSNLLDMKFFATNDIHGLTVAYSLH